MSNACVWFEIYVQDMERAKRFYEAVLATKLEKLDSGDMEMWGFASDQASYGAGGALVKMQGVPSGGSSLVYFGAEDAAVPEGRVKAAGGSISKPKFSIGKYGFIALAVDTEGNMFGLHSMK